MKEYKDQIWALGESIKHWERMIEWAKKIRNKSDYREMHDMERCLGESWGGEHCPLCSKNELPDRDCRKCIIKKEHIGCNENGSYWRKVNVTATWEEWIEEAIEMLNFLISLKEKYEEES